MKINPNASAMPQWDMTFDKNPATDLFSAGTSTGLTIRQQIAKDFMVAMLANPALLEVLTADDIRTNTCAERVSVSAIKWTDIFIAELNK